MWGVGEGVMGIGVSVAGTAVAPSVSGVWLVGSRVGVAIGWGTAVGAGSVVLVMVQAVSSPVSRRTGIHFKFKLFIINPLHLFMVQQLHRGEHLFKQLYILILRLKRIFRAVGRERQRDKAIFGSKKDGERAFR